MPKESEKTDFDLVLKQFEWIYCNYARNGWVRSTWYPRSISGATRDEVVLGNKISFFNPSNYCETRKNVLLNNEYCILFRDGSLFLASYHFLNKHLCESSLEYIPWDDDQDDNFNSHDQSLLSKYFRVDYCEKTSDVPDEAKSHLHLSLFQNDIRIPVDHVMTPIECLSFLETFYRKNLSTIPEEDLRGETLDILPLSQAESRLHFLSFGYLGKT